MFQINNIGKMFLTRGDTAEFNIELYNEDGTIFVPSVDDVVLFSLKKNLNDENPLLEKTGLIIHIDSEDTRDFAIATYYYDVKVLFGDGSVQTVIPSNLFELKHNVGDWNGEN